ncbi:MAG: hypothetical protein AAFX87_30960, partial [Bacteroidota bacterium]
CFTAFITYAQGPGGGRFNLEQIAANEKAAVIEKITDLSEDQKLLLDHIYETYLTSVKTAREENQGDFQSMRTEMQAVRKDKDDSIQELLNEEQFKLYQELMEERRKERQQRRQQRGGARGQRGGQPN